MTKIELQLSLPDDIASQAKADGLLTPEAIEGLVRDAVRRAAADRFLEFGRRFREGGGIDLTEEELNAEIKAVRKELREARAGH